MASLIADRSPVSGGKMVEIRANTSAYSTAVGPAYRRGWSGDRVEANQSRDNRFRAIRGIGFVDALLKLRHDRLSARQPRASKRVTFGISYC